MTEPVASDPALVAIAPGEARCIGPVYLCCCARCGHVWATRKLRLPGSCPGGGMGCGSKNWQVKAGVLRRGWPSGRPRKAKHGIREGVF